MLLILLIHIPLFNTGLGPKAKTLPFEMTQKRRHAADADYLWIGLAWHGYGDEKSNPIVWHNGQTGGYQSLIAFSRKHKKGLVILSNSTVDSNAIDTMGFKLLVSMLKKD